MVPDILSSNTDQSQGSGSEPALVDPIAFRFGTWVSQELIRLYKWEAPLQLA